MAEQKYDSFRALAQSMGIEDDVADCVENEISRMMLLRFIKNPEKPGVIANYNNKGIVFPENQKDVNEDEVWVCSVKTHTDTIYYAKPLLKITPWILMNFDEGLRKSIINTLWEQNKKGYEEDFKKKYRDEEFARAATEVRAELESVIRDKNDRIRELESLMQQDRVRMNSMSHVSNTIELTSDKSEEGAVEPVVKGSIVLESQPITESLSPPSIPSTQVQTVPGFPERIVYGTNAASYKRVIYKVFRESEDVLYSDSFTDSRYFVHISNDCKMLVIRPHEFGSAYAVNRRITLRGLNKLNKFKEKCELVAESSSAYNGMVVYLN